MNQPVPPGKIILPALYVLPGVSKKQNSAIWGSHKLTNNREDWMFILLTDQERLNRLQVEITFKTLTILIKLKMLIARV